MKRSYTSHHNRPHSRERAGEKRPAIASQLGGRAVAHTSIIASRPGYRVGLQKPRDQSPFDTPEYVGSIQGEKFASLVLESTMGDNEIDNSILTARQAGELIKQSIDSTVDPDVLVALKQLSANICGVENATTNPQQMIATLDTVMSADDLSDFIGHVYEWSHEKKGDSVNYTNEQMTRLSGFRVETSFAKLARAAGFTVTQATRLQDGRGMDFLVDGVPFDLKSSEKIAIYHTEKHKRNKNRFHTVKFVPPITAEDFDGRLVVPDENIEHILETTDFQKMVEEAIERYLTINAQAVN